MISELDEALGDNSKDVVLQLESDDKRIVALIDKFDIEFDYHHLGRIGGNELQKASLNMESEAVEVIDK